MVTCVLPSGRSHHNSPLFRTSVNFFPKRVAMECVKGMQSSVSSLAYPNMNATCNVGALLVDANNDLTSLVAQALAIDTGQVIHKGVEANLCHNTADNLFVIDLCLSFLDDILHNRFVHV